MVPLKFHSKYLARTLKDVIFIRNEILRTLKFMRSYVIWNTPLVQTVQWGHFPLIYCTHNGHPKAHLEDWALGVSCKFTVWSIICVAYAQPSWWAMGVSYKFAVWHISCIAYVIYCRPCILQIMVYSLSGLHWNIHHFRTDSVPKKVHVSWPWQKFYWPLAFGPVLISSPVLE